MFLYVYSVSTIPTIITRFLQCCKVITSKVHNISQTRVDKIKSIEMSGAEVWRRLSAAENGEFQTAVLSGGWQMKQTDNPSTYHRLVNCTVKWPPGLLDWPMGHVTARLTSVMWQLDENVHVKTRLTGHVTARLTTDQCDVTARLTNWTHNSQTDQCNKWQLDWPVHVTVQ